MSGPHASVASLPILSGALTDNQLVRALDAAGLVQAAPVTVSDVTDLGGGLEAVTVSTPTADLVVVAAAGANIATDSYLLAGEDTLGPIAALVAEPGVSRLNVKGGVGNRVIDAITEAMRLDADTWQFNGGVTYTAAQLDTLLGIGGLTPGANTLLLGTGAAWSAASAATVRAALDLEIGTDVQAYDADLTTLGAGGAAARTFLGLGTGDAAAFLSLTLDNPLSLANGGTGASSAAGVRAALDLEIGVDVQAYDADLTTLGAGGANARAFLGIGAVEHAVKTSTQAVTTEATITYQTVALDSADVTHSSGEFIIVTTGTYRIDAVFRAISGSATFGQLWLTDDTAAQGSDVETTGTRTGAGSSSTYENHILHAVIALDAGDTVRVRGVRTAGATNFDVESGRFTIQRIG